MTRELARNLYVASTNMYCPGNPLPTYSEENPDVPAMERLSHS